MPHGLWLRITFLLLAVVSAHAAEIVQAVEFPYDRFPKWLWERELVWMKNIGVKTVALSLPPSNAPADPRSDWVGLVRLVRRVGLRAWVTTSSKEAAAQLATQLEKHGGPIAFSDGGTLDVPPPPSPIVRISATDPSALTRSRQFLAAAKGTLLWTDVEDTLTPGLRRGVVSFAGSEQPGTSTLRRSAALLKYWAAIIPSMRTQRRMKGAVPALQLSASGVHGASAVLVTNSGAAALRGELRPMDPSAKRPLIIPSVEVPPGESLWLPVNVPLAGGGLCDDCTMFAPQDRIVYATAELHSIEFENGILACEFVAPVAGSVVIQLSRKPSGPLLAGGRPAEFEWDAERSAVRLPVPAGKAPLYRVRIGLAIEPPDQSAFFSNTTRLVIGQPNLVSTAYSSEALAGRSRLLAPPGFRVTPVPKGPLEIDYEVTPPDDALHGEFVPLALEADGVRLGRTRLQLFRPASLRIREALAVHYGTQSELALDPPLVTADPAGGRNLTVVIRNNSPAIRNFVLEASGEGLTFLPAKAEMSVAAQAEREVSVRVMAAEGTAGASGVRLRLSSASTVEQNLTVLWIRRGDTVVHSADVDGDGAPDWLIESRQVRAVFSGSDGRWMEFVWKDSGTNLLGEAGTLAIGGPVSAQSIQDGVVFTSGKTRRTVRLNGRTGALEMEQDAPLDGVRPETRDAISLTMERNGPSRVVFSLRRQQE